MKPLQEKMMSGTKLSQDYSNEPSIADIDWKKLLIIENNWKLLKIKNNWNKYS